MASSLFDTVVAVHVLANLAAWGPMLAWPWLPRRHPDVHLQRARLLAIVVTRAATVALITGMGLAYYHNLFAEPWVIVPLAILIILLGIVGGVLTPQERRLAALAEAEDWTSWQSLQRTNTRVALACAPLIALAIFMMVVKPG